MPFKKKYTKRAVRKYRRPRRRLIRRKNNIKRPFLRAVQYSMTSAEATLGQTIGQFSGSTIQFALNDIPDYTKFTEMWEEYRIDSVMVTYYPPATQYSANVLTDPSGSITGSTSNIGITVPTLYLYADYDDLTAPTSEDNFLPRPNLLCKQWTKPITYKLKPKVKLETVGNTAVILPRGKQQWIDTTAADLVHYGLKTGVQNNFVMGMPEITYHFRIKIAYILSFRGLKYSQES